MKVRGLVFVVVVVVVVVFVTKVTSGQRRTRKNEVDGTGWAKT